MAIKTQVLEEKENLKTIGFWTDGDGFTDLLRTFIREGQFKKVYDTLKDGGLPAEEIKAFFLLTREFKGDTRVNPDLDFVPCSFPEMSETLSEYYYYAFLTGLPAFQEYNDGFNFRYFEGVREQRQFDNFEDSFEGIEDYEALMKVFIVDEIIDFVLEHVLKSGGFKLEKSNFIDAHIVDGVILKDGTFIRCGSQEHVYLYPILYGLFMSDSSRWMDDQSCFHISSSQLSGKVCANLEHANLHDDIELPDAMIDRLFALREWIHSMYGDSTTTAELIRGYVNDTVDKGGKFNNLSFLKKYYPEINLPLFSLKPIEGVKNCIRTSPKYSLAGLLNSKFDITESSIDEINEDWIKFKDVRPNNELHTFYQEYIEGGNGVFHYWEKSNFTYSYSENRGDIVNGVKSTKTVTPDMYDKIRALGRDLYEDLQKPVQVEFVVKGDELYLVQLRLLENNSEKTVIINPSTDNRHKICYGKTFSFGKVDEITPEEILVVDSDCESELLLGKKALIVKNDVEFSHILALSKALRIPSMFNTGDFEFSKKMKFVAYNEEAWIVNID